MNVDYVCHMGDDLTVANCARVSFGKWKQEFDDSDAKLIRYLAKHEHISPFFHPQITLRVTAPIFVANQAKRHQVGFAINEISRRYVDDEPEFFYPESWRAKPEKSIKQGSGGDLPYYIQAVCADEYNGACQHARQAYKQLLNMNAAPELARAVLPQSMHTQWIWTGSLFAYARLCRQRLPKDAQKEIQQLARAIATIVEPLFPVSWKALMTDWNKKAMEDRLDKLREDYDSSVFDGDEDAKTFLAGQMAILKELIQ